MSKKLEFTPHFICSIVNDSKREYLEFYNHDLSHEEVMDLVPMIPIAEHELAIHECLNSKLLLLFQKIKLEPVVS